MKAGESSVAIPMTIVAGFLGAGKTTLLNHLLDSGVLNRGVTLIVNDFGKVAVDASLIQKRGRTILELKNGCICCSLQGDLVSGLSELLKDDSLERLVMETSGMTNLGNLVETLEDDRLFAGGIRIDQVITVVDARLFPKLCRNFLFAEGQVRHASVILVNRCDGVGAGDREGVRALLAGINPGARIVETEYCAVDPAFLIPGIDLPNAGPAARSGGENPSDDRTRWYSSRVCLSREVESADLKAALSRLPEAIVRIKGFFRSGGEVWSLQGVWHDIQIRPAEQEVPDGVVGQLVAIGSEPIQDILVSAFAGWSGVEVVEDTKGHDHHDHSPA